MPPRKKIKATRSGVKNKASNSNTAVVIANEDATPGASDVAKPQAPPRRNVRGRRGALKDMVNMPLDVVLEIAQHLTPRDLLNLARTDKTYRGFFMSKKQAPIWKAARVKIEGLPELPPWLSEPSYANLMFFNNCHHCLKPNIQHAYYQFGVRYCSEYCGGNILQHDDVNYFIRQVEIKLGKPAEERFLSVESSRKRRGRVYFGPQYNAFCKEWEELTNTEDQIQFVQERQKDVKARRQVSYELERWAAKQKQQRKNDRDELIAARLRAVFARLRDEGWSKELAFMDTKALRHVALLPAVHKPTKLTDKVWKSMRDELAVIMQGHRTDRLQKERLELLTNRMQLLRKAFAECIRDLPGRSERLRTPVDDLEPTAGDVACLPEFRELVEADSDVVVTQESFALLMKAYPELVASWTDQQKAKFTNMVLSALKVKHVEAAVVDEVLDLAIATFSCSKCCDPLRWPFILSHRCFRIRDYPYATYLDRKPDFEIALSRSSKRGVVDAFQPSAREVHACVHLQETRGVIRVCGQDPDKVTWQAMQACSARLMCKLCNQSDRCQVYDWHAAIEHECLRHIHDRGATGAALWQLIPEDQAAQAASLAAALDASNNEVGVYKTNGNHYLACARCTYSTTWVTHLRMHIQNFHGILEPVDGVDLYAPEESLHRTRKGLPLVWMYSTALAEDPEVKKVVEAGKGFFASFPSDEEPCAAATSDASGVCVA